MTGIGVRFSPEVFNLHIVCIIPPSAMDNADL